jgi:catechol 2,3-dioxygenase-like lactoylglutathione lyase family enzyme
MLEIGTVVMGVDDFKRAVDFWTAALDYVPKRPITAEDDFMILVPRAGQGTHLALDTSESPVQEHPRVHLDLHASDAEDQRAQIERLVSLGGSRADWDLYPEDPDFVVMEDTEGNRFCIIDSSHGS